MSKYPDLAFPIYGSEDVILSEEEKQKLRELKNQQPNFSPNNNMYNNLYPQNESEYNDNNNEGPKQNLPDTISTHFAHLQGKDPSKQSTPKSNITILNSKISFKSYHGFYICAERPSIWGYYVNANRTQVKNFEKWTVLDFGNNRLSFKSYHNYFLAVNPKSKTVYASAKEPDDTSIFIKEDLGDNKWALKWEKDQLYLCVEKSGVLMANRSTRDKWEALEIQFH